MINRTKYSIADGNSNWYKVVQPGQALFLYEIDSEDNHDGIKFVLDGISYSLPDTFVYTPYAQYVSLSTN